jgi:hypothetical protein
MQPSSVSVFLAKMGTTPAPLIAPYTLYDCPELGLPAFLFCAAPLTAIDTTSLSSCGAGKPPSSSRHNWVFVHNTPASGGIVSKLTKKKVTGDFVSGSFADWSSMTTLEWLACDAVKPYIKALVDPTTNQLYSENDVEAIIFWAQLALRVISEQKNSTGITSSTLSVFAYQGWIPAMRPDRLPWTQIAAIVGSAYFMNGTIGQGSGQSFSAGPTPIKSSACAGCNPANVSPEMQIVLAGSCVP